jgi:hypothetical protein
MQLTSFLILFSACLLLQTAKSQPLPTPELHSLYKRFWGALADMAKVGDKVDDAAKSMIKLVSATKYADNLPPVRAVPKTLSKNIVDDVSLSVVTTSSSRSTSMKSIARTAEAKGSVPKTLSSKKKSASNQSRHCKGPGRLYRRVFGFRSCLSNDAVSNDAVQFGPEREPPSVISENISESDRKKLSGRPHATTHEIPLADGVTVAEEVVPMVAARPATKADIRAIDQEQIRLIFEGEMPGAKSHDIIDDPVATAIEGSSNNNFS